MVPIIVVTDKMMPEGEINGNSTLAEEINSAPLLETKMCLHFVLLVKHSLLNDYLLTLKSVHAVFRFYTITNQHTSDECQTTFYGSQLFTRLLSANDLNCRSRLIGESDKSAITGL